MPQPTMMYILSHVLQSIPYQMLDLAFKPREFNTTVEQRIISQVIEGPVLLDTNLVGGKQRTIIMNSTWQMNLDHTDSYGTLGGGIESTFYAVPAEAREYRNISSVLGVSSYIGGAMSGAGGFLGGGNSGNDAMSLLGEMVGTHTMRNNAIMPQVTLEGSNILKFYPEVITDGLAVRVMLEQDSEFLNMNTSAIFALRNFCLCAVQRYIVNQLIVPVDETEVVAGMEIGVIKTLIMEYKQEAEKYQDLLIKLKGAMHTDPQVMGRLMYHMI